MVDYHKEYGCNKKGANYMKRLEKENVELAGRIRTIREGVKSRGRGIPTGNPGMQSFMTTGYPSMDLAVCAMNQVNDQLRAQLNDIGDTVDNDYFEEVFRDE